MSEFDQEVEPPREPEATSEPPEVPDPYVEADNGDHDGIAEPQDDEEPPEPAFLIRENAFGPGAHSVKFIDGEPVGQWLAHSHPRWRAERVLAELLERGLPVSHAEDFARRRAGRDRDTETLAAVIGTEGMWGEFVRLEGERSKRLEPIRAAFLAAQKKK